MTKTVMAEKKSVKEYGIVIFPSEECLRTAELLNKEIAAKLPSLQNPSNQWHVSLYHGAFSETYIAELKNIIATLPLTSIGLSFDKIYSSKDRWVNLDVKKNQNLIKLHNKIAKTGSRYFQRELESIHDAYSTLSDKKKAQVDNYGMPGVLEEYKPHMTLFYQYPADPKLEKVAKEMAKNIKPMKCKASKIAIAELEYNGNISKVIYSLDFP